MNKQASENSSVPAFINAGKEEGLQIWRIEQLEPKNYPKNQHGKFYTGDSYIVLSTKKRGNAFEWNIHFWLGNESSQDEQGTAAIMTVHLDDKLGGAPIQHREVQNHESDQFASYFKNGIQYLEGGVASGFRHVDPDEFETRFFHVKGRKVARLTQVEPSVKNMNHGDCFILDLGKKIYTYIGKQASIAEKNKANEMANNIKNNDHQGRAEILIIDQFSSRDDKVEFFTALGGGTEHDIKPAVPDDEVKQAPITTTLSKVSDASGKLEITKLSDRAPFDKNLLDTNDCFILEGANKIFVWVGKGCTQQEKRAAMDTAKQFITKKNYPSWTGIERLVEGGESSVFKSFFDGWGELQTRLFHARIAKAGQKFQVDEIVGFTKTDLWEDDVMLLDTPSRLYLWIGADASPEEKAGSKRLAEEHLQKTRVPFKRIETVQQGKEPSAFWTFFSQ